MLSASQDIDRTSAVLRYVYLLSAVTAVTCAVLTGLYVWHHRERHEAETVGVARRLTMLDSIAKLQASLLDISNEPSRTSVFSLDAIAFVESELDRLATSVIPENDEHLAEISAQLTGGVEGLKESLAGAKPDDDHQVEIKAAIRKAATNLDHLREHVVSAGDAHHRTHSGRQGWNHHLAIALAVIVAGGIGMAWLLRQIVRSQRALAVARESLEQKVEARTAQLAEKNRALGEEVENRQRLEQEIVSIASEEQRRIAHHMHDDLGQQLTAVGLTAKYLERELADRGAPEAADAQALSRQLESTSESLRRLVRRLYPSTMTREELMRSLRDLASDITHQKGITVSFEAQADGCELNHDHNVHVFGIVREAVANAVRHARASSVDIRLTGQGDSLRLIIADDGIGFSQSSEAANGGVGLRLMRYRANVIGASLQIRSTPDNGTTIEMERKTRRPEVE